MICQCQKGWRLAMFHCSTPSLFCLCHLSSAWSWKMQGARLFWDPLFGFQVKSGLDLPSQPFYMEPGRQVPISEGSISPFRCRLGRWPIRRGPQRGRCPPKWSIQFKFPFQFISRAGGLKLEWVQRDSLRMAVKSISCRHTLLALIALDFEGAQFKCCDRWKMFGRLILLTAACCPGTPSVDLAFKSGHHRPRGLCVVPSASPSLH